MDLACNSEPVGTPIGDKLMMINDMERELLQLILDNALKSQQYRNFVTGKLGPEYIAIAEELLLQMKEESGILP